jgi:hypothetical protein
MDPYRKDPDQCTTRDARVRPVKVGRSRGRIQPSQSDTWSITASTPQSVSRRQHTFLFGSHVHSTVTIFGRLHVPSCHHVQPLERHSPAEALADRINKLTARFSPAPSPQPSRLSTPDPSAQRESFKTSGEAGVGKRLRLDSRQGLMN